MAVRADPDYPSAAEWLAAARIPGEFVVVGAPTAACATTVAAVRSRLATFSTYHSERDVDVRDVDAVDAGDLAPEPTELDVRDALGDRPATSLVALLGGDGSVVYPGLLGLAGDDLSAWGLVTVDAHHDVRSYDGRPRDTAVVRALVDAGLPGDQTVQVGISGFANSGVDRRWCEGQGIDVVTAAEVRFNSIEDVLVEALDRLAMSVAHIYVDLDVGVLDRAFAPGCPGSLPGGLWPRELFAAAFLAGRHAKVRAVSIVGVDAEADIASVSIDSASLCLLNAAAGLRERLH